MKKNIGFITLDSSLVQWLRETLRTSGPQSLSAQELLEGFRDLLDGTAGSLMLELGEAVLRQPGATSSAAVRSPLIPDCAG